MCTILEYLPFSLRFMRSTGLIPSSNLWIKLFSYTIALPMTISLNILIIANLAHSKEDILLVAEAFESLSTYGQLTARKFIFLKHGQLIEEILQDCHLMWAYDSFGPKLESQLRKKLDFCVNLVKALTFFSIGTISLFCITALMDPDKPLPLICWIPDVKYATEVIFISEVLMLCETLHYVLATESFYLLIATDLQVQFKLLGKTIESINFREEEDKKCLEKITKCVWHHRWLLKAHLKLNKVFSEYFIIQYATTVPAVAIQIYLLLYRSLSFDASLKSISYLISVMFQAALYFIPSSNIGIEAENFSQSIYLANWEESKNVQISKHLLLMLMKSQKSLSMMGAGMLRINRPEYMIIMRLGFSIATVLGGRKQF